MTTGYTMLDAPAEDDSAGRLFPVDTVAEYFDQALGHSLPHLRRAGCLTDDELESLQDMPANSTCGDACVKAINAARALSLSIKAAGNTEHLDAVRAAAVHTCLVFING